MHLNLAGRMEFNFEMSNVAALKLLDALSDAESVLQADATLGAGCYTDFDGWRICTWG